MVDARIALLESEVDHHGAIEIRDDDRTRHISAFNRQIVSMVPLAALLRLRERIGSR
jgi:hypothetical protein